MNDSLTLIQRLEDFATKFRMAGKGPLCVALVVTRHAKRNGLPIEADSLLADSGRQVSGLGKAAVQNILAEHGIKNVLAEEGGRTSRGSVGNMRNYIGFLNDLHQLGLSDLDVIELWWIERVKKHFLSEPFTIRIDPAKSIRTMVMDIIGQAERRQSQQPGSTLVGTVLQHLVGAKLNLILDTPVEHYDSEIFPTSLRAVGKYCTIGKQEIISDHYILWSFSGRKYFLINQKMLNIEFYTLGPVMTFLFLLLCALIAAGQAPKVCPQSAINFLPVGETVHGSGPTVARP